MTTQVAEAGATTGLKYAWSSIAQSARNYGNMLIEWALQQALGLPEPLLTFDSFKGVGPDVIDRINRDCLFVLSPGCTALQRGQNEAYKDFDRITVPKPCFGGSLWMGRRHSLRGRVRSLLKGGGGPSGVIDLSVARNLSMPIGSRDTFTHETLSAAGLASRLIGCPTLLSPRPLKSWNPPQGRKLALSLARGNIMAQYRLIRRLRRDWEISLLVHEPYEATLAAMVGGIRVVAYQSASQYMEEYGQADLVITGRLHGALPAIRQGTPVIFYGDPSDTRFTLLNFLGLPINPLDMGLAEQAKSPPKNESVFERAYELREAFVAYAREYDVPVRLEL